MTEATLSSTGKVILGMLRMRPRSGYEIKAFVDDSTAFFWSAGYGSIYPELKRLREAGLIEGTDDPAGDRRRVVYDLTDAGRRALSEWITSDPEEMEMRDEPLLQLFFASTAENAVRALDAKAQMHAAIADRLHEIEPRAVAMEDPHPHMTLRYGIAFNEFARDWCEREAARIRAGNPDPGGRT